jgi:hypothetical protein
MASFFALFTDKSQKIILCRIGVPQATPLTSSVILYLNPFFNRFEGYTDF